MANNELASFPFIWRWSLRWSWWWCEYSVVMMWIAWLHLNSYPYGAILMQHGVGTLKLGIDRQRHAHSIIHVNPDKKITNKWILGCTTWKISSHNPFKHTSWPDNGVRLHMEATIHSQLPWWQVHSLSLQFATYVWHLNTYGVMTHTWAVASTCWLSARFALARLGSDSTNEFSNAFLAGGSFFIEEIQSKISRFHHAKDSTRLHC